MTRKRTLSLVLAVVLLLSTAVIPSYAESEITTDTDLTSEITWEDVLAGVADPYDYYGPIDPSTVPEAVGIDLAHERQHIERLYEEEGTSLYNVKFKNADGTVTEYIFDYPVKYVDEAGDIKDITLQIESDAIETGAYVSADNSIETTMSRSITDGIGLNYADLSVTLIPILESNASAVATASATASSSASTITSTAELIDDSTVSYYYDDKTTIEYSLTYSGFKEDIVVSEYTGQTEYEFTLLTEGLTLENIDGSYYLTDGDAIKATLGDIIIFTADEKNNTLGSMSHRTVREDQEYIITIHVDADYLRDEKTAYPIRIDPTIEISGSGSIEDVTINSASASSGSSGSLYVGKRENYGISRVLMRFPGLNLSSVSSADVITKAVVEIRDILCESETMVVYCNVFTGNTWTESTASWSNVNPDSYGVSLGYKPVSYSIGVNCKTPHRYAFDITAAVKGWKTGNYSQSKGIIFHSSTVETGSTYINKTFASYNRATNKPSLTLTHESADSTAVADGTYYLNNKYYGRYLRNYSSDATAASGLLSSLGTTVQWQIRAVDNGYVIRSATDTTKYLAVPADTSNSSVELVTVSDSAIPSRCIWNITTATGGGCLIKNKYNSKYLYINGPTLGTHASLGNTGTTSYYSRVWRLATTSYYGNSSSNTKRELASGFSINSLTLDIAEPKAPTINLSPSNALWASASDFSYTLSDTTLATVDNATGKLNARNIGTTTVTAKHKVTNRTTTFTVKVNKNAIIVIPGIFGSELYIGDNNPYFSPNTPIISQDMINILSEITNEMSTTEILALVGMYLLNSNIVTNIKAVEFVNMFYNSIKCNDDGSSKYDVYTKKYVYVQPTYAADDLEKNNPIYTLPTGYDDQYYSPHAGLLDTYYTLIDSLYTDSTITSQYAIEFFSYDWRLSNAVSAERLNAFINECGYDKVILVAHSMGGLVASGYMAMGQTQLNKVKEVYMLSSPFEGTPEVINVWANVDFSALTAGLNDLLVTIIDDALSLLTLTPNALQNLFGNYSSIYELFPTQNYISISSTPYLLHHVTTVNPLTGSTTETICSDYTTSMQLIADYLPHFNIELMTNAEEFHSDCIVNNKHITYSVNCRYFYSTGKNTTTQLKYFEIKSSDSYNRGINVETVTTNGDGLVPSWSATVGRSGSCVESYSGNHMYTVKKTTPISELIESIK